MNARTRFQFDTDFSDPRPRRDDGVPSVPLATHLEEVRRADEAAFLRGVMEGRTQDESDDAARLAGATQRLAASMLEIGDQVSVVLSETERDAIALALAIARRLAGAALARYPMAEIEDLARQTFRELRSTPHVVARVEPALVERVTALLERIGRETGFAGRIVVLGDELLSGTDVQLEWADGGVTRDFAALDALFASLAGTAKGTASEGTPT
jgi:flagellar assembly protein FliH